MISIIVPVHNGENVISRCLGSIYESKINIPFEIIVVDGCSTDRTREIVQQFPCLYFRIKKSGVAAARNFAIKNARGEILFFFDSDVRLKTDTISMFLRHFHEDKDADIIQGRWDKDSSKATFSSRFLLLKYWYDLNKLFVNKHRVEVANLETGCLAIKSEVFNYFNGFDENYKLSGGEEHELGVRLLGRYKIYYYIDIFVFHDFGRISETLVKIFKRTINFSILSFKARNKDFMRLHSGSVSLQDKVSVVLVFLLVFSSFLLFFNVRLALTVCLCLWLAYLVNISNFLKFLILEEGLFFAVAGSIADFILMLPRLFGLLVAVCIFYILRKVEFKI